MSKRSEYRRMMRALEDLDRVDAGKTPKRGLRPEVRSATERWVHGNTAKVASAYATGAPPTPQPRRQRRRWMVALAVLVALAIGAASIPAARHAISRTWTSMTADPHRLLPVVPVTTHGDYVFEHTTGSGNQSPVTYNPCQVIRYTVNSDLAPAGSAGIIPAAVAEVSRLTGLKFQYVGVSHTPVTFSPPTGPTGILVSYAPAEIGWSDSSLFVSHGSDVVGLGGSEYVTQNGFASHYVTGAVALRADMLGRILTRPRGRAEVMAVVLHELGHLVGLAHSTDPHELMYAKNVGQLDFGPGDRGGLALLGQGSCTNEP